MKNNELFNHYHCSKCGINCKNRQYCPSCKPKETVIEIDLNKPDFWMLIDSLIILLIVLLILRL